MSTLQSIPAVTTLMCSSDLLSFSMKRHLELGYSLRSWQMFLLIFYFSILESLHRSSFLLSSDLSRGDHHREALILLPYYSGGRWMCFPYQVVLVMADFLGLLCWTTGCLDVWSNIILGISLEVFWMRLTLKLVDFELSRLPLWYGWALSNWLKSWREQKYWLPLSKRELSG